LVATCYSLDLPVILSTSLTLRSILRASQFGRRSAPTLFK
jgi:hypothetical protein